MDNKIKRPFWLTYLLINTTAIFLMSFWVPLIFIGGTSGDYFMGHDLWKSALLTGLYLFLLKKALRRQSGKALLAIALGFLVITAFTGKIMHDSSWINTFLALPSFLKYFLLPTLIVSAHFLIILVKLLGNYRGHRIFYYLSAAFFGACMVVLYFLIIPIGQILTDYSTAAGVTD